MDPSTLQHHHQEIMASESLDSMLVCTKATQGQGQGQGQEKKPRPPDEVLKCPRCDSTNTKFCYYNNYSLSQPRYFCKSCRRYWTKGGTLRNVPVGGGCRKNRRSSSSSSSSSSRRSTPDHLHQPHHHHLMMTSVPSSSIPSSSSPSSPNSALLLSPYDHHHHHHHHNHNQNHPLSTNDLSLAFARLQKQVGGYDNLENHGNISLLGNPSGNSHFDLFGSSLLDPQSNGLQHLYYGGSHVNVNANTHDDHHQNYQNHHQMGLQFDHNHNHNHNQNNQEMMSNPSSGSSTPTTIKQELGENRVLCGLPWQLSNGEANYMNNGAVHVIGGGNINEIDSLKESWSNTGVLNPTWHSLLNSPLM